MKSGRTAVAKAAVVLLSGCGSFGSGATAAPGACVVRIDEPEAVRTPAGQPVLIDVESVAHSDGGVLLVGSPTVVWAGETGLDGLAVNEFIGVLYSPSGDVELLSHPAPDTDFGLIEALPDADGWLLLWTERGAELAPGFYATSGLYEARWSNGAWQYTRRVPAGGHLSSIRPSGSTAFRNPDGTVVWALRTVAPRDAGRVATPEGVVVMTRRGGDWTAVRYDTGPLEAVSHQQPSGGDGVVFIAHSPWAADRGTWVTILSSLPVDGAGTGLTRWYEFGPELNIGAIRVHATAGVGVRLSWVDEVAAPAPALRLVTLSGPDEPAGGAARILDVQPFGSTDVTRFPGGSLLFAANPRPDSTPRAVVAFHDNQPSAGGGDHATCTAVVPELADAFLHLVTLDGTRFLLFGATEVGGRPSTIRVAGRIEHIREQGGFR